MEQMPLVTVIIPVYNTEEYLHQCLDSVCGQTYRELEILLIDDGSTDTSGEICDEYARSDSRVRVVHQKNRGLSASRNTGISMARGKYIQFVDSDDWIAENCIETSVTECCKDGLDLFFFNIEGVDQTSYGYKESYFFNRKYDEQTGKTMFINMVKKNSFNMQVWCYLMSTKLIKNNIQFPDGIIYEDFYFTFRVFMEAERVGNSEEAFYYRRLRDGSIITSKPGQRNWDSFFTVLKMIAPYYYDAKDRKDPLLTEAIRLYMRWILCGMLVVQINGNLDKKYVSNLCEYGRELGLLYVPENFKRLILYGYGKRGRSLIEEGIITEYSEIWDAGAEKLENDKVSVPNYASLRKEESSLIVVTVDSFTVLEDVKRNISMSDASQVQVVHWIDYVLSDHYI